MTAATHAPMGYEVSHQPRSSVHSDGPAWSTPAHVQAALATAAACAAEVAAATPRERGRWLEAIADAVESASDELVALADEETALGVQRLTGELNRGGDNTRFYASVCERGEWLRLRKQRLAGPPELDLRRANLPIGPIAVFGASNFPFQFGVVGHDTCSGLAAGCPVVVKAHPAHPRLSVRLAELAREGLAEAGAPEGTFAIVVGFDAGMALVDAPEIRAVAFTGSQQGGIALVERARQRPQPIPVYAEMGTVNPVLVTGRAGVRMKMIAKEFVDDVILGAGQFCTKPGLLLTPSGADGPEAVAHLIGRTEGAWLLTAAIAAAYADGIADMERAGARVVARGGDHGDGYAARPTVLETELDALTPGSRLLSECFGPVAVVAQYDDIDAALEVLTGLQPSLVGTVYASGEDDPDLAPAVSLLASQTGRVVVNGPSTSVACVDAIHHGGPWPSTSNTAMTSVGADALTRFTRLVAFQNVPESALPAQLRDDNPWPIGPP